MLRDPESPTSSSTIERDGSMKSPASESEDAGSRLPEKAGELSSLVKAGTSDEGEEGLLDWGWRAGSELGRGMLGSVGDIVDGAWGLMVGKWGEESKEGGKGREEEVVRVKVHEYTSPMHEEALRQELEVRQDGDTSRWGANGCVHVFVS